jgi:hypothetical protein
MYLQLRCHAYFSINQPAYRVSRSGDGIDVVFERLERLNFSLNSVRGESQTQRNPEVTSNSHPYVKYLSPHIHPVQQDKKFAERIFRIWNTSYYNMRKMKSPMSALLKNKVWRIPAIHSTVGVGLYQSRCGWPILDTISRVCTWYRVCQPPPRSRRSGENVNMTIRLNPYSSHPTLL